MENSITEVGTVVADDDDDGANSMIYFTLQNSLQFDIDRDTGTIQTIASLDYESRQEYSLIVWAHDMGDPSRSTSVTVLVNVNSQWTKFTNLL